MLNRPLNDLPGLNSCLNATSTVLLVCAWIFIRRGYVRPHVYCIIAALASSGAFLTSYLYYHFVIQGRTYFQGTGVVRSLYLGILLTHTVLAVAIVPLIAMSVFHAARRQWHNHRRIARWTMPLWLYVSVTGVVVYWMLYQVKWQ